MSNNDVRRISTESEFRRRFDEIAASAPQAIVIDLLLRWTNPGPDMELPPPEIDPVSGVFSAGLRCQRLLESDLRTNQVPVVIYTIGNSADFGIDVQRFPRHVRLVRKELSYENLFRAMKELTGR